MFLIEGNLNILKVTDLKYTGIWILYFTTTEMSIQNISITVENNFVSFPRQYSPLLGVTIILTSSIID